MASSSKWLAEKSPSLQPTRMQKHKAGTTDPDNFIDFSIYAKGTSMLRTIEDLVGRKRFDCYAKDYLANFHLKPIDSKNYI